MFRSSLTNLKGLCNLRGSRGVKRNFGCSHMARVGPSCDRNGHRVNFSSAKQTGRTSIMDLFRPNRVARPRRALLNSTTLRAGIGTVRTFLYERVYFSVAILHLLFRPRPRFFLWRRFCTFREYRVVFSNVGDVRICELSSRVTRGISCSFWQNGRLSRPRLYMSFREPLLYNRVMFRVIRQGYQGEGRFFLLTLHLDVIDGRVLRSVNAMRHVIRAGISAFRGVYCTVLIGGDISGLRLISKVPKLLDPGNLRGVHYFTGRGNVRVTLRLIRDYHAISNITLILCGRSATYDGAILTSKFTGGDLSMGSIIFNFCPRFQLHVMNTGERKVTITIRRGNIILTSDPTGGKIKYFVYPGRKSRVFPFFFRGFDQSALNNAVFLNINNTLRPFRANVVRGVIVHVRSTTGRVALSVFSNIFGFTLAFQVYAATRVGKGADILPRFLGFVNMSGVSNILTSARSTILIGSRFLKRTTRVTRTVVARPGRIGENRQATLHFNMLMP